VKLDNILVFRSDFSLVKLCDFGSGKKEEDNKTRIFIETTSGNIKQY
jgi:hypothetical protein